MGRDDRRRRAEQRGEQVVAIEAALVRGPWAARQDLLGVRVAPRSVTAAADLPRDDRRADRLLGPPVRGVEISIDQEAEERRQFNEEMPCEALQLVERSRIGEHVEHLVEEMPTRAVDAVRSDRPGRAAVADVEGMRQNRGDARGKPRPGMVAL